MYLTMRPTSIPPTKRLQTIESTSSSVKCCHRGPFRRLLCGMPCATISQPPLALECDVAVCRCCRTHYIHRNGSNARFCFFSSSFFCFEVFFLRGARRH